MDVRFESTVVMFHDGAMACRMTAAVQQAAASAVACTALLCVSSLGWLRLSRGSSHSRSCGVVVITSALHAEGPQFDPGRDQAIFLPLLVKYDTFFSARNDRGFIRVREC